MSIQPAIPQYVVLTIAYSPSTSNPILTITINSNTQYRSETCCLHLVIIAILMDLRLCLPQYARSRSHIANRKDRDRQAKFKAHKTFSDVSHNRNIVWNHNEDCIIFVS